MVVYSHFGGIAELIRAVVDQGFKELDRAFSQVPVKTLKDFIEQHASDALDDKETAATIAGIGDVDRIDEAAGHLHELNGRIAGQRATGHLDRAVVRARDRYRQGGGRDGAGARVGNQRLRESRIQRF